MQAQMVRLVSISAGADEAEGKAGRGTNDRVRPDWELTQDAVDANYEEFDVSEVIAYTTPDGKRHQLGEGCGDDQSE